MVKSAQRPQLRKRSMLVALLLCLTALFSSFATKLYLTRAPESHELSQTYLYRLQFEASPKYKANPYYEGANPWDVMTTYRRLTRMFPYTKSPGGIPKKIFQMWITPGELDENTIPYPEYRQTWRDKNPDHEYKVLSGEDLKSAVRNAFEHTVPEVWEAMDTMPLMILQSDFSRYLMLFLEGGVWADLDTTCDRPISKWYHNLVDYDIRFVGSVEHDVNDDSWPSLTSRRLQFENWAFTSDRFHPVLAMVIAHVIKMHFTVMYEGNLNMYSDGSDAKACNRLSVIDWTGPGVFTDGIYRYMNEAEKREFVDIDLRRYNAEEELYGPGTGDKINWRGFSGLNAPVIFNNDVCILPKSGFRCTSDFDESVEEYCYLTHHFARSWFSEVE
ncbi:hypothetical protein KL942_003760 [Ogataea angusta]|uniref:Mannosyltransferase n=1 Tax=Pichia angusta TaxID=870730 RepID=A0ABQ7RWL0_PICAN|nr:hypothetical protein KL942_003760 [Ogataea angusta]KAG7849492.1 hypothetical protein KL940_002522 [Ogataea angusta]